MLLLIFELISLSVFLIMFVSGNLSVVLKDFERRNNYGDVTMTLFLMALLCGWFLAPYFMWLVYRYFEIIHKK